MTVPRFWRRQNERYNLIGKRCIKCNSLYFPPREICLKCKTSKLENYKFKGTGEIITNTTIRVPPNGFELQSPYVVAIIQLDEGPRLTTQIVDCSPEEVKIGQKVKLCFRKISEDGKAGAIYYGYKFKLVR